MASFFVVLGTGEKKLVSSDKPVLRIGRLEDSEIFIDEPVVSRRHAEIFRADDKYFIRDTGSRNGTYLSGNRVFKEAKLAAGDVIIIGNSRIVFEPSESLYAFKDQDSGPPSSTINIAAPAPSKQAMAPLVLLETVAAIAKEIVQTRPLEGLLDSILRLCVEKTGADKAIIILLDESGEPCPRACYLRPESEVKCAVSKSIVRKTIEKNQAILVKDVAVDEGLRSSDSIASLRIRSAICTPLWNGEKTIGVLYVDTTRPGKQFDETDLHFFSSLSGMIAEKIENTLLSEIAKEKQRLDTELEIARDIQTNLFPRTLPRIRGYEVSPFNRPSTEVGGDYFDVVEIAGCYGIAIADVAGKGIGAAMLMSNLQALLRSKADGVRTPSDLLSQMNVDLLDRVGEGRFISLFYMLLDPEAGTLIYCNAGHNPPFLVDHRGEITTLDVGGIPLGIFADTVYPSSQLALTQGCVLVLYSDGVTECTDKDGEQFGEDRLRQTIRDAASKSAEAIAQAIVIAVDEFRGDEPASDDMTLVVLKRTQA